MKLNPVKLAPALIAICVIVLVCFIRLPRWEFFDRLERMTYDLRVNAAHRFPQPVATNLGAVFISDDSITALRDGSLDTSSERFHYGLYWPRHIYGRLLRELSVQGARAIAFDILFAELRPDHNPVPVSGPSRADLAQFLTELYPEQNSTAYKTDDKDYTLVESDDYFAWQLNRSGKAIVAAERNVLPHQLFATNALVYGDISAESDPDGVLRRAKAFQVYTNWHRAFKQLEANSDYGVDLSRAQVRPGQIILPRTGAEEIRIPVDADNNFDLEDIGKLPPGVSPRAKAFTEERVWHMGIVLAAQQLGLDLTNAKILLNRGEIILSGQNGLERILPVDSEGYFYINWELTTFDSRLMKDAIERLIAQDNVRSAGQSQDLHNVWQGKLAIVGSMATGNDLSDRGATPLEKSTFLFSKHWNVANSIITGRFVHRALLGTELAAIVLLGVLAALLTWQLPPLRASLSVLLIAATYVGLAFWLYVQRRYWLPLVFPVGALVMVHVCLVTWRVVFEQTERRRVKSVFSRIVSPEVVNELLGAETLSLGGARREATVLFADVRGFTELTDVTHERAVEYVLEHKLTAEATEAYYDEVARETLNTVNTYLALVADMVKKHDGTLDKYIGDCVMAFWGAPTANAQHALACVRAAIEAQQAMSALNGKRTEENKKREIDNRERVSAGLPPKPLLATLSLGTGINTGMVTVGLMGSEAHILNYTVFGRDVNVASRLEHESGRGRIVISETTHAHLRRGDPALAAKCLALEPVKVKGIRAPVKIYEMPW